MNIFEASSLFMESSRKFRRKAHVLLHQGKAHLLPVKSFEVMSPWDLGGNRLFLACFT